MLLSTDVWVGALVRRANQAGAFATVVRKGDARAGTVLVKTYNPRDRSVRLFSQSFGPEGEEIWIEPQPGRDEADLDAYAQRQARFDPDLWLVEIEDSEGRHFLTEPVQNR